MSDKRITQLDAAPSIALDDVIPIVVNNITYKCTPSQILALTQSVTIKNADYTALTTDRVIEVNAVGVTITLPTAVGNTGKEWIINNVSGGDMYVTCAVGGQTIDGEITQTIGINSAISVYSNGTDYKSY